LGDVKSSLGDVYSSEYDSRESALHIPLLIKGDVFGEYALLSKHPRSATVQCTEGGVVRTSPPHPPLHVSSCVTAGVASPPPLSRRALVDSRAGVSSR
jgi:hypothetical protein